MSIYYMTALGVGLLWAYGSMISVTPARHLGAVRFNMWRMIMVTTMLSLAATIMGTWSTLTTELASPLVLSGFVGIFLGDTALFATLRRMGPRRTPILFATNAPFVTLIGWFLLDEILSAAVTIGIAVTFIGVVLAIIYGKRKSQDHDLEAIHGPAWLGIGLGLLAAICQAVGIILSRPIMESGADPVAASAIRVGIAAIVLVGMGLVRHMRGRAPGGDDTGHSFGYILGRTAWSGFIGMGVGMTLLMFALGGGNAGIVATLSATTPVWVLPMLWWKTRQRPAIGAFVGSALVVLGCGLIFGAFDSLL